MADTTNATDLTATVREMVGVLLVRTGAAVEALVEAQKAFDAGDVDHAKLIVHNATVGWNEAAVSVNALVYECLPRTPEAHSYG